MSYLFREESVAYETKCVVRTLVGEEPDEEYTRRNREHRCREQVLEWSKLSADDADFAATKLRNNLNSKNPKRQVTVEQ